MSVSLENKPIGVLIVDDHPSYRTIAAEVVAAAAGFTTVACAIDRSQALRLLDEFAGKIDLVLMDVNIGDEDGIGLCEEVTAAEEHPHVVLVTALEIEELPDAAMTCGARGYLPKALLRPSSLSEMCSGVYDWPDVTIAGRSGR